MKILMRADTHCSIIVGESDYGKPKYTFSQVTSNFLKSIRIHYEDKVFGWALSSETTVLLGTN